MVWVNYWGYLEKSRNDTIKEIKEKTCQFRSRKCKKNRILINTLNGLPIHVFGSWHSMICLQTLLEQWLECMWIQNKGALSLAWLFQFTRWKTMIWWLAALMWMNFIDLWKLLSLYHLSLILSLITYTFWKRSGWTLPSKRNFILSSLHPSWGSQLPIYQNKHPHFTWTVYQPFPTTFPAWTPSFSKSFSANFKVKTLEFFSNIVAKVYQKRGETLMSPTVWTDLFRDFKAKLINKLEASVLFPLWFFCSRANV